MSIHGSWVNSRVENDRKTLMGQLYVQHSLFRIAKHLVLYTASLSRSVPEIY